MPIKGGCHLQKEIWRHQARAHALDWRWCHLNDSVGFATKQIPKVCRFWSSRLPRYGKTRCRELRKWRCPISFDLNWSFVSLWKGPKLLRYFWSKKELWGVWQSRLTRRIQQILRWNETRSSHVRSLASYLNFNAEKGRRDWPGHLRRRLRAQRDFQSKFQYKHS